MRRFLISCPVFVLLAVGIYGSVFAVVLTAEIVAYRRALALPADKSIVVCGDSQTQLGCDPAHLPGLENRSGSAVWPDLALRKMNDLLRNNPHQVKTWLVDVSPYGLAKTCSPEPDASSAVRFMLDVHAGRLPSIVELPRILPAIRDHVFSSQLKNLWRSVRHRTPFPSSLAGGFCPMDSAGFLVKNVKMVTKLSERAAVVSQAPTFADMPALSTLERFAEHVREDGGMVVLITTPFAPQLISEIPEARLEEFRKTMRRVALRLGCRYLDFLEELFPLEDWYDCNHLNRRGAVKFTNLLRTML